MINKTISHYKILEKVGEGGMGVVYKAQDLRLKRTVALKFLPSQATRKEEDKARFIREAQSAAVLDHSNICTVYEIDEIEDQVFIAMAYIEGITLKEKIASGPLSVNDTIEIAIQIAGGLREAHDKGVIHRDIKSSNILITKRGQVKIMDFGLAKSSEQTQITTTGTRMGTAAYMSPEQARGEDADHRTDIWSLGIVIFEMLTGELPFKGNNMQAVMFSILSEEPQSLNEVRPDIPPELTWIVKKSFIKNPEERYQSMREMLADLRMLKADSASEITKTLPSRSMPKKKKPALFYGLVGMIILSIIAAAYFIFLKPYPSEVKNSIAVLPFEDLSPKQDQEYFCDGMTEAIIGKLSKLSGLKVISRTSAMRYKNSKKTLREIGDELGVETILEGSILRENSNIRVTAQLIDTNDDTHIWSNEYYRKIESIFEVQDELSKSIAKSLQITLTPASIKAMQKHGTDSYLAYDYYLKGLFYINSKYINTQNINDFNTAIDMFQKAIELDNTYALAYYGLSWAYDAHYTFTRDKKHQDLVIENCEKAFKYDPNLPEANAAMGWVYLSRREWDNAYKHFKRAVSSKTSNAELYHMAALFFEAVGLPDIAVKLNSIAADMDPLYLYIYINRASDYEILGKNDLALSDLERALKIAPENTTLLKTMAYVYIKMGDFTRAKNTIDKIEKSEKENINHLKALLFAAEGNKEEALNILNQGPIDEYSDRIYAILGMKEEALDQLEKIIKKNRLREIYKYSYIGLKNCPFYKSIADEPEFKKILQMKKQIYNENYKKYGDIKIWSI